MKGILQKILIFAGTIEGRKLSEYLAQEEVAHTICVATEYGEIVLNKHPLVNVHQGRMNQEKIEKFLNDGRFNVVVDATHPYAKDVTRNIQAVTEKIKNSGMHISYFRLKRNGITSKKDSLTSSDEDDITYFETNEACARALEDVKGNILLTIGSKELSKYCASEGIKNRLYVRVIPSIESLSLCMEQGIHGKQILAMQGPFTIEMNEALIRQYRISYLVTKESGASGGYPEKLEAAKRTETKVFLIGLPEAEEGYSFFEICDRIEEIIGKRFHRENKMEIILAGIGMGAKGCLTKEVERAINEADILLGAERMLENFSSKSEKQPFYQAEQIIPYIQGKNQFMENKKAVILFSGDSGFYSGCRSIYAVLEKEIHKGRLNASLRILPGISSVAYLASCVGESYHDAAVYSIHGKRIGSLVQRIKNNQKTFLLTSGVKDVNWLGEQLKEAAMPECEIITGYQLSYDEQRIEKYTPSECCELDKEGLYTCLVRNPYPIKRKLTHGIADKEFIRDRVPMTKEEVREVGICKLKLHEGAVVYDIGSGTGSVAVEIAALSEHIQVYAIEQKQEAVSLIEKNKKKFGVDNVIIVEAKAPEGLSELPVATQAFIGGSSGRLKEIVETLRQINSSMRVVVTAVSMETICEMKEILSMDSMIKDKEVVQLQISRAEETGSHHLMKSENPVWIFAFSLAGMSELETGCFYENKKSYDCCAKEQKR